tara:strand:- start:5164 stop:5595 length:432 start_codon:yes stop_codon:yes gene_type:complete
MKADKSKQDVYKGAIVPIEDIESGANELRVVHEKVTDAQAELVEMMLHDGCNPTEAAKRMGRNKSWAYNTLNKQHVIEYRQSLAMTVLGWDATQAMATMRTLLQDKSSYVRLEAAKDLLDRAGFSMEGGGKVPNTAVQVNFNL